MATLEQEVITGEQTFDMRFEEMDLIYSFMIEMMVI